MSDIVNRATAILEAHPDVSAFVITTRDGMVAKSSLASTDPEIFSAMIATAFGAVETSLMEIGQASPDHISVRFGASDMVIIELDIMHLIAILVVGGSGNRPATELARDIKGKLG